MGVANLTSDRSIPKTEQAISPLRRRMIEDMTVRNFAADTQRNYLRAVKNLAVFLCRSLRAPARGGAAGLVASLKWFGGWSIMVELSHFGKARGICERSKNLRCGVRH
jgi:hypothetical protein